jgi:hypothetical protein
MHAYAPSDPEQSTRPPSCPAEIGVVLMNLNLAFNSNSKADLES